LSLDFRSLYLKAERAARDAGRLLQKLRAREWKSVNKFYIFCGGSGKIYTKLIHPPPTRSRPFWGDQSEGTIMNNDDNSKS
jgi:hypothetical protein